jgi:hypothetical protein
LAVDPTVLAVLLRAPHWSGQLHLLQVVLVWAFIAALIFLNKVGQFSAWIKVTLV